MTNHTMATFRHVNKENFRTHDDALEFPDGRMVLLTHLLEGQQATVLRFQRNPLQPLEQPKGEFETPVDCGLGGASSGPFATLWPSSNRSLLLHSAGAPTVSAIAAPRAPSGLSPCTVLSCAV
jgi:hypothetical protein